MASRRKAAPRRRKTETDAPGPAAAPPARQSRGVVTRINPEGLKALRQLALDRDIPLQALAVEAFNDVLMKHGRRPAVRNPLLDE